MQKYHVVIIGAGAAGLMCAIEAGKRGRKVLVIDHARKPAEKIRISGGGRCNFTNLYASPKNYLSKNPHFCVSALKRYTQQDFMNLVRKHHIMFHEKTLGQLFCDESSQQIIDMLLTECAQNNVEIRVNTSVASISKTENGLNLDDEITCESLVIACGGPSIPKMGSSGFGYKVAEQFGLAIVPPRAALVPFIIDFGAELAGISCPVIASCNGAIFKEAMLFTHKGLSGPAILQISSYWNDCDKIRINFFPDNNCHELLKAKRDAHPKQELQTILGYLLPKRLADYLAAQIGHKGNVANLNNDKLKVFADKLQNWEFAPTGTEGYRTAEVTIGGVDTDEISSKTFEAKKVSGLYFIGEVLDVTGWLGGYNFQWAWSSGHACGQFV